ncbi:hypothetical protein [Peribacillus simplex]|uniref:hypothetical protein n=1 Tax=Peribacillus simplex TaxID=1478 RepID=UPI003339D6F7
MELEISFDKDRIYLKKEDGSFYGYTNFTPEVFSEISSVNWYVSQKDLDKGDKTYIYTGSKKFGGYTKLHQVIMILWYGIDKVKEAYSKQFIVEHHDNDAFNCLIENLSFAPHGVNLAKAHTYDKERIDALPKVAINFFKDFTTQNYQITLGFNQRFTLEEDDGSLKHLTALRLLYNDDFRIVFQDISNLLYQLIEYDKFDLDKLHNIDYVYTEDIYVATIEGEESYS